MNNVTYLKIVDSYELFHTNPYSVLSISLV
jgi:hypothetical protein